MITKIDFTKRQLEKLADQIRLLSWAEGTIFTAGLHINLNWPTVLMIAFNWLTLQWFALKIDKRSEL